MFYPLENPSALGSNVVVVATFFSTPALRPAGFVSLRVDDSVTVTFFRPFVLAFKSQRG